MILKMFLEVKLDLQHVYGLCGKYINRQKGRESVNATINIREERYIIHVALLFVHAMKRVDL